MHFWAHEKEDDSKQHGFAKRESCLTNLTASCDEKTESVERQRSVDDIDFSKAFETASHSILVSKVGHHSLDGWTTIWVKNWAQMVVV